MGWTVTVIKEHYHTSNSDCHHVITCTGIPLLFVVVGLAARSDYYGVRGDDGELSL